MKRFIKRCKDAYEYDRVWDNETFVFQTLLTFFVLFGMIIKAFYMTILFVTVPLWIIPYIIYYICKSK